MAEKINLCECGCGRKTKIGQKGNVNRFIHGHQRKHNSPFKKGKQAPNKGKTIDKLKGKNNGMFGKKRPDLVKRNKTVKQKEAVIKYNKNRVYSDETKRKIGVKSREWNLYNNWWVKENNPSYVNGCSEARKNVNSSDYYYWRKSILERDKKCLMCEDVNKLHVHHIIPVSEDFSKVLDNDNGITLCSWCHKMTHNKKLRPFGFSVGDLNGNC